MTYCSFCKKGKEQGYITIWLFGVFDVNYKICSDCALKLKEIIQKMVKNAVQ